MCPPRRLRMRRVLVPGEPRRAASDAGKLAAANRLSGKPGNHVEQAQHACGSCTRDSRPAIRRPLRRSEPPCSRWAWTSRASISRAAQDVSMTGAFRRLDQPRIGFQRLPPARNGPRTGSAPMCRAASVASEVSSRCRIGDPNGERRDGLAADLAGQWPRPCWNRRRRSGTKPPARRPAAGARRRRAGPLRNHRPRASGSSPRSSWPLIGEVDLPVGACFTLTTQG